MKTGQSLRLSVGFPEGFDASMAGIVFKAYHFTRNDDGAIISVEEIPVTVTQYGLVILCDSFSPFEIVALDANMIGERPNTGKTIVAAAGEGGSFLLAGGTTAAGKNGVVTLTGGQSVTLKVRPDHGKTLGAVLLDDREVPVSADGTVVIRYEDIQSSSGLLRASFLSAAVRQADEAAGMTSVTPGAGGSSGSGAPGSGSTMIPSYGTAYASTQLVEIDGQKVQFEMYALKDADGNPTNYIKVRDLALALSGTAARFSVDWNGAVNLVAGKAYAVTGTENSTPFSGNRPYTLPVNPTNVNGAASDLTAITLTDDNGGGYTYYQLRDLGRKLGFNVDWSAGRGVFVETDKPYTGK